MLEEGPADTCCPLLFTGKNAVREVCLTLLITGITRTGITANKVWFWSANTTRSQEKQRSSEPVGGPAAGLLTHPGDLAGRLHGIGSPSPQDKRWCDNCPDVHCHFLITILPEAGTPWPYKTCWGWETPPDILALLSRRSGWPPQAHQTTFLPYRMSQPRVGLSAVHTHRVKQRSYLSYTSYIKTTYIFGIFLLKKIKTQ